MKGARSIRAIARDQAEQLHTNCADQAENGNFLFPSKLYDSGMKRFPLLVQVLVLLAGSMASYGQTSAQLLSQAQTEYLRGDVDSAKRDFAAVLKLDPKNPTATAYLKSIEAEARKQPQGNQTEKQLAKLIVSKVDFKDATLDSVLDFLKKTASTLSNDQVTVNFVPQIPQDKLRTIPVTLSLTNVPYLEVLRYVGSVAGVQFKFDQYAIIVAPAGGASQPAQSPEK